MPCEPIKTPGGYGIICTRGAPRKRCSVCNKLGATYQCDAPAPERKSRTCDAYICGSCTQPGGRDIDYCHRHAYLARAVNP